MPITRKISPETARQVYERDNYQCINCSSTDLDIPHHAWYGGERQYDEGRNDPDRLVTLCRECHYKLHFQEGGSQIREKCKEYLRTHPSCHPSI